MYNGREKREYERIEGPYVVRFQIINFKSVYIFPANWDMVALKDISVSGASFNYNDNLGIDSFLNLKIDLPASALHINCVGKIIRIEQPQPNSMFRIAAEFTEIGEQEKEMISTTVEKALENDYQLI